MRLCGLALIGVAIIQSPARAEDDASYARDDIVDIRHDRYPRRDRVLGWTDDGAIVVRQTRCGIQDLSGYPFCDATLVVASVGTKSKSSTLFHHIWDAEGAHTDVSYEQARDFIRAERAALASLPALMTGSMLTAKRLVKLRVRDCRATLRSSGKVVATVRRTAGCGAKNDEFIRGGTIERVEASPNADYLAIFVTLEYVDLDYYFDEAFVVVLSTDDM